MRKTVQVVCMLLLCVCGWDAAWLVVGRRYFLRAPMDVHERHVDLVLQDARAMEDAARLLIPLPTVRRSADAFRQAASIDESAARMLTVEDMLARHDPAALEQAKILASQTERIAGSGSPAMAIAGRLLAQAYAQQAAQAIQLPAVPILRDR